MMQIGSGALNWILSFLWREAMAFDPDMLLIHLDGVTKNTCGRTLFICPVNGTDVCFFGEAVNVSVNLLAFGCGIFEVHPCLIVDWLSIDNGIIVCKNGRLQDQFLGLIPSFCR